MIDTPAHHLHARAFRSVLQRALLSNTDKSKLRLSSRLVRIQENNPGSSGPLSLLFADGHRDEVDLLIGADGVRSVVRQFAFPEYKLMYTGKTAYRGLIPAENLLAIPGFPDAVSFWHGPGEWVYTCNLRHGMYELTCMAGVTDNGDRVSWGEKADMEEFRKPWKVLSNFLCGYMSVIWEKELTSIGLWSACPDNPQPRNGRSAFCAFCGAAAGVGCSQGVYCISRRCISSLVSIVITY